MKINTHRSSIVILVAIISLVFSVSASAKGNKAAGEQKSAVCQACHGADGKGTDPTYPILAGQHRDYLVKALSDYRSGDRGNAVMASFATNLTDQDIEDLAAFYASLEGLKDIRIK